MYCIVVPCTYLRYMYRYELESHGCTVHAEAPAPTRHTYSDGRTRIHALSNDRIGHVDFEITFPHLIKCAHYAVRVLCRCICMRLANTRSGKCDFPRKLRGQYNLT